MVWFQCEDCGENLKKPKLANHFRICSANKLSCIDCGEMFGQDSVQGHTQCITEAEKYGPKGQGKISNGATPKSNNNKQQQPDFDTTVGLSDRPPWFCSLCNTKATSKQTLLLHADGKKHRAKARSIHASKVQQSNQTQPAASQNIKNVELRDSKQAEEGKIQDTPHAKSETDNGSLQSKKKRKLDDSESNRTWVDAVDKKEHVATQGIKSKAEGIESRLKKAKHNGLHDSGSIDDANQKIKLKKSIISTLKTNPSGVLKMKKLKKLVLNSLRESGVTIDETQLNDMLEQKINTSSRFRVDGKYVRLAGKD